MACTERRFFGVPIVEESPDELSTAWGKGVDAPGVLLFADRPLTWRLVRSRSVREFLREIPAGVVPNGRGIARQIRVATGCPVRVYPEFQSVVRILARAEEDSVGVYLVGRSPDQLQRVEQNVRATFPALRVVGRVVFHPANAESIATAIRKAGPRIVFIGGDSRKVISWLREQLPDFGPTLALVAHRAARRMAGQGASLRPAVILRIPVRLILGPVLIGHRLRARRRLKKQTS